MLASKQVYEEWIGQLESIAKLSFSLSTGFSLSASSRRFPHWRIWSSSSRMVADDATDSQRPDQTIPVLLLAPYGGGAGAGPRTRAGGARARRGASISFMASGNSTLQLKAAAAMRAG